MSKHPQSLSTRLEAYPELKQHLEKLLEVIENKDKTFTYGDDAEEAVVVRGDALKQAVLGIWGSEESERQAHTLKENKELYRHGKKKSSGIRDAGK